MKLHDHKITVGTKAYSNCEDLDAELDDNVDGDNMEATCNVTSRPKSQLTWTLSHPDPSDDMPLLTEIGQVELLQLLRAMPYINCYAFTWQCYLIEFIVIIKILQLSEDSVHTKCYCMGWKCYMIWGYIFTSLFYISLYYITLSIVALLYWYCFYQSCSVATDQNKGFTCTSTVVVQMDRIDQARTKLTCLAEILNTQLSQTEDVCVTIFLPSFG